MENKYRHLMHFLGELDKQAQELERITRELRMGIHNIFWDLIEESKDPKNNGVFTLSLGCQNKKF